MIHTDRCKNTQNSCIYYICRIKKPTHPGFQNDIITLFFSTFAAFSSDKEGENREFTWVSFVNFSPIHEDYFAAEKYVEKPAISGMATMHRNIPPSCPA